jgi:hypothetical protein
MKTIYSKLAKKCGEEFLNILADRHGNVRLAFISYLMRGDSIENAIDCAFCDVYEGDDDLDFANWSKDQLDLAKFLILFGGAEEVQVAIDEFNYHANP